LGAASSTARDQFSADLQTALQTVGTANITKTNKARDSIFGLWTAFCDSLGVRPDLQDIRDREAKLSYLLVFGMRYRRSGAKRLLQDTPLDKPVAADTVANALLAVGKGITDLGQPDPRKEVHGSGNNHPLLAAFLHGLKRTDDPSKRSYPANVPVIRGMAKELDTQHPTAGNANQHVIDLCIVAFYWLLRPAEYTHTASPESRSQAFRLRDIAFHVGEKLYSATDASLNDVDIGTVTAATLTFTDQKNCVRGEQVSQRATNDPLMCPAKALFRLTLHQRLHNAPNDIPLCDYYDNAGNRSSITSKWITNGLRWSAKALFGETGIDPKLMTARSLRPGGATALLCANIDSDVIMLLGRWKSNAMFRYLRIQAHIHSDNFAQRMLDHGSYTFAPGSFTNDHDMPLPLQTPEAFIEILDHNELFDD